MRGGFENSHLTKQALEDLYATYNRREFVHPDPLEFLYNYSHLKDREIVGLVASSLAYGRVSQILKSVSFVLGRMGNSPYEFVMESDENKLKRAFKGFRHRFSDGFDISRLLLGVRMAIRKYGSLNRCFVRGLNPESPTILPGLSAFVAELSASQAKPTKILPTPSLGSACKRLNLYLRWMVRKDAVDPGEWVGIPASKLMVPLDTHMYRMGRSFGFTRRKSADLKTAIEITRGFAAFSPDDPVKYDFALTRLGIRKDIID